MHDENYTTEFIMIMYEEKHFFALCWGNLKARRWDTMLMSNKSNIEYIIEMCAVESRRRRRGFLAKISRRRRR